MSSHQLGNGIRKNSARPIKVYVAENGEHWYCDAEADVEKGFGSAGCSPLSESTSNK